MYTNQNAVVKHFLGHQREAFHLVESGVASMCSGVDFGSLNFGKSRRRSFITKRPGMIETVTQYVVITGLFGAIVWDLLTWWLGLPTSCSHALIGGYAGAVVMRSGMKIMVLYQPAAMITCHPIMGLILGWSFMLKLREQLPSSRRRWPEFP